MSYNLHDSVFLYRQYMAPVNSSVKEIAEAIHEFEKKHKEYLRMYTRQNGHEGGSERLTFDEYNLNFDPWDTDLCNGLAQARNYMSIVDMDKENPFRFWCETEGKPLMGRSRWYVIVDDDQGKPYFSKDINKWLVTEPKDDAGFLRARLEIMTYHIPESEKGKPVRLQRPYAVFNDAMDTWRAGAASLPPIGDYTREEKIDNALPPGLRRKAIESADPQEIAMLWLTRRMEAAELALTMPTEFQHWRRSLWQAKNKRHY